MRHYENIEHYIDGFAQIKLFYRRTGISRQDPKSLEYSKRDDAELRGLPSITGSRRADLEVTQVCADTMNPLRLGQPITINKPFAILRIANAMVRDLIKYIEDNDKNSRKIIKGLKDKRTPTREENVKAMINYGIEILYVVDLPKDTKVALIIQLLNKHME